MYPGSLISVKLSCGRAFLSVPSTQSSWSGERCRWNSLDTGACGRGERSGVRTAVPQVFCCRSFPALLGMDSGRRNLSSFSIQLEVHLAAAGRVTSKTQGDVAGRD